MDPIICIDDLPTEMLAEIFSYLTFEDLVHSVQHVCSRWNEACQTDQLWTNIVYKPSLRPYQKYYTSDVKIASTLKQAPRLQILIIRARAVPPVVLRAITQYCRYLKKLVFDVWDELSISDLKSLVRKCPDIEYLQLPGDTLLNLETSEIIGQFPNIKTLKLNRYNYRENFLKPIADGCPKLQHINLSLVHLTYEELAYFLEKKGGQLLTLSIRSTSTDKKCNLTLLSECTALKTLHITNTWMRTPNEVQLLRTLKHITCLTITSLDYADINSIIVVFQDECMNRLEKLYLGVYFAYEDRLADVIVKNCPRLKLLALQCDNLSDHTLKKLSTLSQLQGLTVGGSIRSDVYITDAGMAYIRRCKKLRYLVLSNCEKITEESMKLIVDFSDLRILRLTLCNVQGLPLRLIPTKLKHLTILFLDSCENVDIEAIRLLRSQMPHLNIHVCRAAVSGNKYGSGSEACPTHGILRIEDDPLWER